MVLTFPNSGSLLVVLFHSLSLLLFYIIQRWYNCSLGEPNLPLDDAPNVRVSLRLSFPVELHLDACSSLAGLFRLWHNRVSRRN